MKTVDIIDKIEAVRRDNNILWMGILRAALAADPKLTKSYLRDIRKNDLKISGLTGRLANGNRRKKNRKP